MVKPNTRIALLDPDLDPADAGAPAAPAQCCVPIGAADMTSDEAATSASLFKALGDPHRVRIVNLLATAREAVCVCDLTAFLGLSQPTVSHHMRKLVDAGLLAREQRGVWAYYSLRDDAMRRLNDVLRFERVERADGIEEEEGAPR
jgi:ArsR family transcriptional regulator, arsenate/arsenite/antimonite-responsive transcriptional repressor